jgi:hypothetical protein
VIRRPTIQGVAPAAPGSVTPGSYRIAGVDLAVPVVVIRYETEIQRRALAGVRETDVEAFGRAMRERPAAARASRSSIRPGQVRP